jgi:hypothetical protein
VLRNSSPSNRVTAYPMLRRRDSVWMANVVFPEPESPVSQMMAPRSLWSPGGGHVSRGRLVSLCELSSYFVTNSYAS